MRKLKIFLVLLVVSFSCNAMAQKKTEKDSFVEVVSDTDTIANVVPVPKKESEVDSLKREISKLKEENQELEDYNRTLQKQLLFADSCFLRVSNDCFRKKYDSDRVNEAIGNFKNMYSPKLQETFSPLKDLLEKYGSYYQEISKVFEEIEGDMNTKIFLYETAKKTNVDKIKKTGYYQNVYSANWTIAYLNNAIDKAIERLRTYDPHKTTRLKLMDLLQ